METANIKEQKLKLLVQAIRGNNLKAVEKMLEDIAANETYKNTTLLDYAISSGINYEDFDMARLLVKNGADWASLQDSTVYNFLTRVNHEQNMDILSNLIHYKAQLSEGNVFSILSYAIDSKNSYLFNIATQKYELKFNTNVRILDAAVLSQNIEIVERVLDLGAPIDDITEPRKLTALHAAVNNEQTEMVDLLIRRGANPNAPINEYGSTALHTAVKKNNEKIALLLINNGAKIDARNNDGKTALDLTSDDSFKSLMTEASEEFNLSHPGNEMTEVSAVVFQASEEEKGEEETKGDMQTTTVYSGHHEAENTVSLAAEVLEEEAI